MLKKVLSTLSLVAIQMVTFIPFAFAAGTTEDPSVTQWRAISAAFCIAFAAFGGAMAQAKAAAAALEGITRNPGSRGDVFVPFILALALIESLVIYALLIAFMIKP